MNKVNQIIAFISQETGVSVNDILSRSRKANIVRARQLSMWLCRLTTEISQQQIAYTHGCERHATVIWAFNQVEDERSISQSFKTLTNEYKAIFK